MKRNAMILALVLSVTCYLMLSDANESTALPSSPKPRKSTRNIHTTKSVAAILVIQSREDLIGGATNKTGTNALFNAHTTKEYSPPLISICAETIPVPEPAPTAPPLPFVYLGKKMEDGHWEAYLSQGERLLIVRAHSLIDDSYRVEAIAPPTLQFTYLPLQQMQTLAIGEAN